MRVTCLRFCAFVPILPPFRFNMPRFVLLSVVVLPCLATVGNVKDLISRFEPPTTTSTTTKTPGRVAIMASEYQARVAAALETGKKHLRTTPAPANVATVSHPDFFLSLMDENPFGHAF